MRIGRWWPVAGRDRAGVPPGTPTRLRPGLPQPHQLRRPVTARERRIQIPITPSIMKSRSYGCDFRLRGGADDTEVVGHHDGLDAVAGAELAQDGRVVGL